MSPFEETTLVDLEEASKASSESGLSHWQEERVQKEMSARTAKMQRVDAAVDAMIAEK